MQQGGKTECFTRTQHQPHFGGAFLLQIMSYVCSPQVADKNFAKMGILSVLVLLFLVLSVHELGHAFAMKRNKVAMEEICIFGFGTLIWKFKIAKIFGDTPLTIRAFPLGAFVKPNEFAINKIKHSNKVAYIEIMSAGISANFLLGALCLFINILGSGHFNYLNSLSIIILLSLGLFPKAVGRLFPILGTILFCFALGQAGSVSEFANNTGSVVSIAKETVAHSKNFFDYVHYLGYISISLALCNSLPVGGLDGGKILISMISKILGSYKRRIEFAFNVFTIVPLLLFVLYTLGKDIIHLFF